MNEEPMKKPEDETPTAEPETFPETAPETARKKKPSPVLVGLFDYVEMFAIAVFVVMVVFTFLFRVCRVDGRSMENTLKENQALLLRSAFYTPKQDDIVVFHLTDPEHSMEKTLVKRVIATGGQEVVIDTNTATITVDGVVYPDTHSVLKESVYDQETKQWIDTITGKYKRDFLFYEHFDRTTGIFRATVPEGCVFVMGDNRNNSKDSRNPDVGFVDERAILGGVVLRFAPFQIF